jgi:hypothetical protein
MYLTLLYILCFTQSYYSLRTRIIKTAILNFAPQIKQHHIGIHWLTLFQLCQVNPFKHILQV